SALPLGGQAATLAPVDASPTKSARSARALALGLSWLAYASYYLGRKGFSVTKAAIAADLGVSEPMLAAIDTGFLVAYAAGQVPCGLVADRAGARRLLGLGMLVSAAACALFGAAGAGGALLACF